MPDLHVDRSAQGFLTFTMGKTQFRGLCLLPLSRALKGFATFWEFSFYGQKKVADYEYHSLFAEKIHFHT